MVGLAVFSLFLHLLFDFPRIQPDAVPRGDGEQEIYFVIVLYVFMLLGMLAQYGYTRFEKPKAERPDFDLGLFLAPVFASPIIFIPLLAALQNAEMDLSKLDAPRLMMFSSLSKMAFSGRSISTIGGRRRGQRRLNTDDTDGTDWRGFYIQKRSSKATLHFAIPNLIFLLKNFSSLHAIFWREK